jgi:hypothetical protein
MKHCHRSGGGRGSVRQRVLRKRNDFGKQKGMKVNLRSKFIKKRKSLKTSDRNIGQTIMQGRRGQRALRNISLKSKCEEEVEVVYDRNGFTKAEIGTFGKLCKKPFVLVHTIVTTANGTLATHDISSDILNRKEIEFRRSFIHLKKLSVENFKTFVCKDKKDVDDQPRSLPEIEIDKDGRESENEVMSDEYVDEDTTEHIDKLLDIWQRLSSKVRKHKEKRILQVGSTDYNHLEELKKITLLIETNSQDENE